MLSTLLSASTSKYNLQVMLCTAIHLSNPIPTRTCYVSLRIRYYAGTGTISTLKAETPDNTAGEQNDVISAIQLFIFSTRMLRMAQQEI